jgi:hypothetical protein
MILPNFLCVGAQKAGTTSLYHILSQHPEIYLSERKEIRYFDQNRNFKKGIDWYCRFFKKANKNHKAIGEITPSYLYYSEVPQRIYEVLGGKIKLIFLFRHPVDRAFSHYTMNKREGFESRKFLEVIEQEPLNEIPTIKNRGRYAYIKRSLYSEQLQRYLQYFDRENMGFLIFERLFKQRKSKALKPIVDLLQLSYFEFDIDVENNPTRIPTNPILKKMYYNSSFVRRWRKYILPSKRVRQSLTRLLTRKPNKPDSVTKKWLLNQYFLDDIQLLEKLTGHDLSIWYD